MRKYLVSAIILVIIISVLFKEYKNIETYNLKANHSLEAGNDIPPGTYMLKAEGEGISINVNKKDGTSVSSQIIVSKDGKKHVEYKFKIPKETRITTDKDAILIKK